MTARWEDALDAQLSVIVSHGEPQMRQFVDGWSSAEVGRGRMVDPGLVGLADKIRWSGLRADPIWVDPDMQTLWEGSIPGFQPEPLHPNDLLVPSGFVYLPRPHLVKDVHNRDVSIRAILWDTATLRSKAKNHVTGEDEPRDRKGIAIYTFHAAGDDDGYERDMMSYPYVGPDSSDAERRMLTDAKPFRVPFPRGTLTVDALCPWSFGVVPSGFEPSLQVVGTPQGKLGSIDMGHEAGATVQIAIQTQVQSLWRLMQQTLSTRDEQHAPGAFRRRWERLKLEPKKVTVIRLRRPKAPDDPNRETRTVDWSHRWLVRGFWRNQWFPSLSVHRQVYIHPYIKGPEDKPLVVETPRVFELVR